MGPINWPKAAGEIPTGTVAATVLVFVSITDTLLSFWFATYTFLPSGVTAIPKGLFPTFTLA